MCANNFVQEMLFKSLDFCPCGSNHLQKIRQYPPRVWVRTGGPVSYFFLPQNQNVLKEYNLLELSEIKGKGRYFPLHNKNRLRLSDKDMTTFNLEEKVPPVLRCQARKLINSRRLNSFESMVKGSRATLNHPVVKSKVQVCICLLI